VRRTLRLASLGIVLLFVLPRRAAAQYLDPGVGGLLVQALVALIAAAVATSAVYWRRIKRIVSRLRRRGTAGPSEHAGE
jgi:hypothetical protein